MFIMGLKDDESGSTEAVLDAGLVDGTEMSSGKLDEGMSVLVGWRKSPA